MLRPIPCGIVLAGLLALAGNPARADLFGNQDNHFTGWGLVLQLRGGAHQFQPYAFVRTANAWNFDQAANAAGADLGIGYEVLPWLELHALYAPHSALSIRGRNELLLSGQPIFLSVDLVPYRGSWLSLAASFAAGLARYEVTLNEHEDSSWGFAARAGLRLDLHIWKGLAFSVAWHYHHQPTTLRNNFGEFFDASGHHVTSGLLLRL